MELIIKDEEIDTEALEELLNRRKTAGSQLDEAESQVKDIDEKIREAAKIQNSWLQYQCHDETEVIKDISSNLSINFTEAREHITKMPTEPLIEEKTIPEVVKELRVIRRTLKGGTREKMSSTINHLIKAYTEHLDDSLDSIYWLRPFKKSVKMLTPNIGMLKKLYHIKDGETRQTIIDNLVKMWEADITKSGLDYGEDYTTEVKGNQGNIKKYLSSIYS